MQALCRISARRPQKFISSLQKRLITKPWEHTYYLLQAIKSPSWTQWFSLKIKLSTIQILQLNKLWRGEETWGIPPAPSDLPEEGVPAPILPTAPAKWTLGDAASPRDGASWGHSPLWPGNLWKWAQPLTARALWAPRITPNAEHSLGFYWNLSGQLDFAAAFLPAQQSPLTGTPQRLCTTDFSDQVLGQLSRLTRGTWIIQSTGLTKPNSALLFLPILRSHRFTAWLSFVGRAFVWLCFFVKRIFTSRWTCRFGLLLCWYPGTRAPGAGRWALRAPQPLLQRCGQPMLLPLERSSAS